MNKNQQIAIAQLVSHFAKKDFAFGEKIWILFPDYKVLSNEKLSENTFRATLKALPNKVKRAIVVKIMAALYIFVLNRDDNTWKQTFIDLMYYEIGSGVEAVLFNTILNTKKYLGEEAFVQVHSECNELEFENYYDVSISINMEEGKVAISTSALDESPFVRIDFERSFIPNASVRPNVQEARRLVDILTNEDSTHIPGRNLDFEISLEQFYNPFCDFYSISFFDIDYR